MVSPRFGAGRAVSRRTSESGWISRGRMAVTATTPSQGGRQAGRRIRSAALRVWGRPPRQWSQFLRGRWHSREFQRSGHCGLEASVALQCEQHVRRNPACVGDPVPPRLRPDRCGINGKACMSVSARLPHQLGSAQTSGLDRAHRAEWVLVRPDRLRVQLLAHTPSIWSRSWGADVITTRLR